MTLQFEGVGFGSGTGAGGKTGTVVLVAMGSQPSTPYTVGSKWFYNGKIYTATTTTATDGGVTPSYNTAYLFNGTYYYWDGSALQGADESNLVHILGTETITGDKTFSGSVALGDNASAQTKPTSDTSDAVATTQFVKDFAQDGEWQKPADWVDIRSGALDNSIYLLVAHSKPVENEGVYSIVTCPKIALTATVSNTNTYDVFIDGIKVATTASSSTTTIDWESLYNNGIIEGGYDIASPGEGNYTTHIVRITPSNSIDEITLFHQTSISGQTYQGTLWAYFSLDNPVLIRAAFGNDSNTLRNNLLQAVDAKNNVLKYRVSSTGSQSGLYMAFAYCTSLVKVPIFEAENTTYKGSGYLAFRGTKIKKLILKNNGSDSLAYIEFAGELKEFETENPIELSSAMTDFSNAGHATKLKKLPNTIASGDTVRMDRLDSLEPTILDDSPNANRRAFKMYGSSGHQTNLIGLVVSSSASFNSSSTPQINITYTNMSRAALVRLFNSMPTVTDSQEIDVTGTTGAGDLTAEDIAIVTGKGWTLTR